MEEELSHGNRNDIASPPSYSAGTTGTITRPTLQAVGGLGNVVGNLGGQTEEEDMLYPYLKYSNHPDVRSHVKQFWSIWAVNHEIQGLNVTNE